MPTAEQTRWFHPTPGRFVLALLIIEALLWLSDRFGWWHKGYAVLTAVVAVGVAMLLLLVWFGVALVFRRRFQFSLRTMLVLTVVVAVASSWITLEMQKAREQREAVRFFSASGCIVFDDECADEQGELLVLDWRFADILIILDKAPLTRLLGRDFFHSTRTIAHWRPLYLDGPFDFSGMQFTKRDVAEAILFNLKYVPDLRGLDLSNMPINDSDLGHVSPLKKLRKLDLGSTKVTVAGIAKLQQALPNCKIER